MAANDDLYDALLQQQVNLQRMSQGEVSTLLNQLRKADEELNAKLLDRLGKNNLTPDATAKRMGAMIQEIRRTRASIIQSLSTQVDGMVDDTVLSTINSTMQALTESVPVEINFAAPNLASVQQLSKETPFGGADLARDLAEWFVDLQEADARRISDAVRAGMVQGETGPEIMGRVMRAQEMTRTNADAITRTAINHASNTARQEVFNENADVILALRAVATLDGRTSPICRARDGHYDAVTPGGDMENVPKPHIEGSPRRPPFHPRCRTLMIAVLDAESIEEQMGERPFVRDKRTRKAREKDFRAEAKAEAGDNWKSLSREERDDLIRAKRKAWIAENVGTVPGDTDYDTWLRRQPASFQNEVLGQQRAELFRNGMRMDQYVDQQGRALTITQLKDKYPDFFEGRVDQLTTAEIARQDELARLRKLKETAVRTEEEIRAAQDQLDEKELWPSPEDQKELLLRHQAERDAVAGDFEASQALYDRHTEEARDLARRRAAYFERNGASLRKNVLKHKSLTDDAYLRSLTPMQQDLILGPERGNMFRRGLRLRQLVDQDTLELVSIEDLRQEFPRDVAGGITWNHREQSVWAQNLSEDGIDAIHTWSTQDGVLTTLQAPGKKTRQQFQYDEAYSGYKPKYEPAVALQHLDEALSTAPIYDGVTYRGLSMLPEDLEDLLNANGFELPHHSSSSVSMEMANTFMHHSAYKLGEATGRNDVKKVLIQFTYQRNGRMIMDHSEMVDEAEVLLLKGTQYSILRTEQRPDGSLFIEVLQELGGE